MLLAVVGHAGDSGGGVECSLNHPRTPSVLASTLKLRYIVALVVPSFSSSFPSISPPLVSTWDHRTSVMGTTSLTPSLALACAFRDRSCLENATAIALLPSLSALPSRPFRDEHFVRVCRIIAVTETRGEGSTLLSWRGCLASSCLFPPLSTRTVCDDILRRPAGSLRWLQMLGSGTSVPVDFSI